jgi:D-3-phosphoglycerate dehydrogenase
MTSKILITDAVDPVCVSLLEAAGLEAAIHLKRTPEELAMLAGEAEGWIIRSGTRITASLIEAAPRLKVIARAGVGVDNVDLEAATRRGVLVINAPDGNTLSTAEHTLAMLMAVSRHIPQANASLVAGRWERSPFTGSELYEKTIGIIGVGKIGQAVAERVRAFGMTVLGYDPVLSRDVAERLGVELVPLDDIWQRADFITVHTPLNEATRGLLGPETLARCKRGVRIINCARGGIVDEAALLEALHSGQVGGAALDVYSTEPPPPGLEALIRHPKVVATPHIAASTDEAQGKVAVHVTEQLIHALRGEPVTSAVNGMAIRMAAHREVQPYLKLAEKLGLMVGQLGGGTLERLLVRCQGDVPQRYAEVLTVAAVKGLLSLFQSGTVNLVNAPVLAAAHGLRVDTQVANPRDTPYTNLIEVELTTHADKQQAGGSIFGTDDLRIVQIDGYPLEVRPEGWLLVYRNIDRPGMLAQVGRLLAEAEVNIGALALGRTEKGAMALTVISVDEPVPAAVLHEMNLLEGVAGVRQLWV